MWVMSLWTSLIGLTEPFFVPEYWSPPSLFNLAERTGFDIESLLFSFAVGGLIFAAYQIIIGTKHQMIIKHKGRCRSGYFHFLAVISAPASFVILDAATGLNPIYSAMIAAIIGFFTALYCRPDLLKKMLASSLLFLVFYLTVFYSLLFVFPEFINAWNVPALSGILIFSIPIEEFGWALTFSLYWSGVFEHFGRYKIIKNERP